MTRACCLAAAQESMWTNSFIAAFASSLELNSRSGITRWSFVLAATAGTAKSKPMNRNYETLCQHLESNDVKFESHPGEQILLAGLELSNAQATLLIHAPANEPFCSIMIVLPVVVPAERRAAMGELLHRLNYDLRVGSFEFGYDEGEVRFNLTILLPDASSDLSAGSLRHWLSIAVHTLDGFCPAILRVAFSNVSPAHAHEQSEAEFREYLDQLDSESE